MARRRRGLTIGKLRRALSTGARLAGDAQAVTRGRVTERIANRLMGRFFGRLIPWR